MLDISLHYADVEEDCEVASVCVREDTGGAVGHQAGEGDW